MGRRSYHPHLDVNGSLAWQAHIFSLPASAGGCLPTIHAKIGVSTPLVIQGFAWHLGHLDANTYPRQRRDKSDGTVNQTAYIAASFVQQLVSFQRLSQ